MNTTPSPRNALTRNTDNAMIGGVCSGIARWLDWDVTLTRVLYVALSLFSVAFPGLIVYLILWLIMPSGDDDQQ